MVKLTALVCVQDQQAQLSDCLRHLWFCDEIVVVADRCSDGSAEIARRHGAQVVEGTFPLESQRKMAGLAACRGDWILEIEPDERVDSALAWEIRATLKMGVAGDHLEIPLHNYLGSRHVAGGWTEPLGASRAVRLFRHGAKQWGPRHRDAGVALGRSGGALTGALRREVAADLGRLLSAFNRTTSIAADDLSGGARRGSMLGTLGQGVRASLHSYVGQGGWREGGLGVALAALAGLHPLVARLKAGELPETLPATAVAPARSRRGEHGGPIRIGAG